MINTIEFSEHQLDRINERFKIFNDDEISLLNKKNISDNLKLLSKLKLPNDKSFGIMLGEFIPNENSKHHKLVNGNRNYYSIIDDKDISDSTGDQFWVIVRKNKITTFMLRKSIQTEDLAHNLKKLRVDEVIKI